MADTKITVLTAITTVDPAVDVLPIVDVSDTTMAASGTTKKITTNQILGSGGTATLASATITGAATVGTTLGVTGVSTFAAGTALLPALTTTGDTNTGIYYPAADTFAVTTGGTERYRVASNGQLLLGTSSTSGAVDIGMVMNKPSASGFVGNVYQLNSVDKAYTYIASAAAALRIDTVAGYTVNVISSTNGVYLANGGTSWLALSDERFKDIIEPISNAVAKVGSLRSVIGKFKSEAEGTRRPFLLAQDVQAVFPEAVDATKPEQLGLSYSEVVPLLVAAIKELTARVQTLEAK
jgi:hypothetical protein